MGLEYGKRPGHLKITNSLDKDTYEWCLRQSKRLKAIDPQMNIQVRNHKLLKQLPEELEHAVKCRCNQNCIVDDIANTLEDIKKSTNIGKFAPYRSSGFEEKQPLRVEFKDKRRERVSEVAKKKNYCHNCGSTDHYANNCPKAKKKFYAIEKVTEEESPTEDSESDSMGDAIREPLNDDQEPREEFLVEYQEEPPGSRHATGHCHQKFVQTHKRCTNIPGYTNQRNGIYTWNSHKNDCMY
ncbi:hypothetical protein O181_106842 [Austropuccinia psidii MF-1]|uniref:CCHC-type domain-containing protein n=1 Tax=Austropuccinia psidii MF-1 TaxID=1389203 RepID=A0A9Q3PNS0_9BASI|nr:hypothetical protein [Austropuccinia psidii MF-1]